MGAMGAEVAAELQAVLAQACAGLEAQEQGRLQEAAQVSRAALPRLPGRPPHTALNEPAAPPLELPCCSPSPCTMHPQAFFLARSRVHYTAEALLAPLVAEAPGDPDVALVAAACAQLTDTYDRAIHWLTKGGSPGGGSAAGDRAGTQLSEEEGTGGGSEDGTQLWGGGGVGVAELRGRPAAHGGGSGALPAAAQACLKEVQGSLDEVIGLSAIKQVGAAVLVLFGLGADCQPLAQHPQAHLAPPAMHTLRTHSSHPAQHGCSQLESGAL